MNQVCTFFVFGVPIQQAGSRAVPTGAGVRLISTGGKGLAGWRNQVAATAATYAAVHGLVDGPIRVDCDLLFPMPTSRPKKDRLRGVGWKITAPDVDKLLRATFDALTASGLIRDDARICAGSFTKRETTAATGLRITVSRLDETDL